MTHKRYATPNHLRWENRTDRTGEASTERHRTDGTGDAQAERRYGRYRRARQKHHRRTRRQKPRPEGSRSEPLALLSRDGSDDDPTVELTDKSDWLRIAVELPDLSLDDVRVSLVGNGVRIRADTKDDSSRTESFDRTIALTETVDIAAVAVTYCDPTLTVLVPQSS